MRRGGVVVAWVVGALLLSGALAVQAKLPAAPPKSDAEKAAEAEKAKAVADKEAVLLGKYQDKAAANYKKNKGGAGARPVQATQSGKN